MSRPIRTCIGCRRRRPKDELLRLALTRGEVALDEAGRLPGRGAYLCPTRECLEAFLNRAPLKQLRWAFRQEVKAAPEGLEECLLQGL